MTRGEWKSLISKKLASIVDPVKLMQDTCWQVLEDLKLSERFDKAETFLQKHPRRKGKAR